MNKQTKFQRISIFSVLPQLWLIALMLWLPTLNTQADVTFEELYPFQISPQSPAGELIQDTNGDFYGTAQYGGAFQKGAIYRITPTGAFTTLHSFDNTNGYSADGALVKNIDGNFYGTTYSGGTNNSGAITTYGTIFRMTPAGALKTLFCFANTNGANPVGTLIHDADGNLYGTTVNGGAYGYGTVFKFTLNES